MEPTAVISAPNVAGPDYDSYRSLQPLRELCAIRKQILLDVAAVFATPEQMLKQQTLGVWRWNTGVTFPRSASILVTDEGCMNFPLTAIPNAHMSVWVQMGEIRIGAILPKRAVPTDSPVREKVINAFDGQPCQRISENHRSIMFDWIFRDGFASYENMLAAFTSPLQRAMMVDRIAGILTHLYMALTNQLFDAESKAETSGVFAAMAKSATKVVKVTCIGDLDFMQDWFKGRVNIRSTKEVDTERTDEEKTYEFIVDMPVNAEIICGPNQDQDSRFFAVTSVVPV